MLTEQLSFLTDKKISLDVEDNPGLSFQLKKLICLFRSVPSDIKNRDLEKQLTCFVITALQKGHYKGRDFILMTDGIIEYYSAHGYDGRVLRAIGYFCQIHFSIYELYYKYELAYKIGEYFSNHWRYYSQKKNSTISDLISNYYIMHFNNFIAHEPNELQCIDEINRQEYLTSESGLYQKKAIILWLYDNYFYKRNDGLSFLIQYEYDNTIKKKIIALISK
ncbi:hypothetical protein [Photorhabdus khanii]|uniref:Uncharacterized protein n=1 Tax=Photorhabdus khanii subsp. guanajuatensis TaxID=2100166 RepID=A0A4R4J6I9_9GAMM|nr:hypothetical protein [Photorhabdus khanii]TDB48841.1 hypothetical protein C5467_18650 [Photorhabdus khanii subsp. guanajuatensis]